VFSINFLEPILFASSLSSDCRSGSRQILRCPWVQRIRVGYIHRDWNFLSNNIMCYYIHIFIYIGGLVYNIYFQLYNTILYFSRLCACGMCTPFRPVRVVFSTIIIIIIIKTLSAERCEYLWVWPSGGALKKNERRNATIGRNSEGPFSVLIHCVLYVPITRAPCGTGSGIVVVTDYLVLYYAFGILLCLYAHHYYEFDRHTQHPFSSDTHTHTWLVYLIIVYSMIL